MFKNDFDGTGLKRLCDRCRTIVAVHFNRSHLNYSWVKVSSARVGKGAGKGRQLDFCDEKCKIIFLKGKRYWTWKQLMRNHDGSNESTMKLYRHKIQDLERKERKILREQEALRQCFEIDPSNYR